MSHRTTAARYSGGSAWESSVDVGVQVPLVERLGGRGARAVEALRRVIAEALETYPLPAARHVEEKVRGDPVQPALERAGRIPRQRPEDADEHFLGQILGVLGVPGQPVGRR